MSVDIQVWSETHSEWPDPIVQKKGTIGYVIVSVQKQEDGAVVLERDIAVDADNAEDNTLAESVVKTIEAKLNEAFPDPNKPEPSKLWVPE